MNQFYSGCKEDVTEIIMNLKSLYDQNTSESDEVKTAYIEFEGEGVVTGADIQADSDIEIMNPEQVIATLSGGKDSKLYMEPPLQKAEIRAQANKSRRICRSHVIDRLHLYTGRACEPDSREHACRSDH